MRIAFGSLPATSALFLDYVSGWAGVQTFYPRSYSLESIVAFSRERPPLDDVHRDRLCSALVEQQKHWGGSAEPVEKLAKGAVAVLTGQQPGLFTGPHYTVLKALTAIKLARAIEAAGVPAVPVFWVAAEDHDYEEIHWASVLDQGSALQKMRVDLADGDSAPVGWLQFRDDVAGAVSLCLSSLPPSEFHPEIRDILESSYRPGSSPVEAFARMMTRIFAGAGLVLANPLDGEIKRIAAPALIQAVQRNDAIRSAVLARSRELSEAGYHEQVKVDGNFTGLFAYRGRSRQALRPSELSTDPPLSPNVLLRPAVQDTIFPTAAYVAGPAEVAYFAQAAAVYESLGQPVPPVFPRISVTVLESRIARAMKKHGIEFLDAFRGRDFMKRKAVAGVQAVELFDRIRDHIVAELESIRPTVSAVDPTLLGALDTSRQKMIYQVESLRTKYVNAEAKRSETLEKHLDLIGNSLFPEKKLQERVINITSFLARYGLGFITRLDDSLSLDPREHQVVEV